MDIKDLKRYQKRNVTWLKKKAQEVFNRWVRERDKKDEYFECISCQQWKGIRGNQYQCGHYYSAGNFQALRFHPDNAHGQCKQCNYFLSGNLLEYRKHLIEKIGIEKVEHLDMLAAANKRTGKSWTREELIEVIVRYR